MNATQAPQIEQHTLARSILLHLLPGVALFGFIHLAGPLAQRHGYPLMLMTSLGILLVLAPIELGIILRARRRERRPWRELLGGAGRVPLRYALPLVLALLIWLQLVSGLWRAAAGELALRSAPLGQLADLMPPDQDVPMSSATLIGVIVLRVICTGIVAPVVEELYFRGYLLPRISRLGAWAAVLNALLFAIYHLWTPLLIPGRTLAWLPTVYVVLRRRSLGISIAVHILANLAGVLLPVFSFM